MPKRDVLCYLGLIVDSAERAQATLGRMDLGEFLNSEDAQSVAFQCNHDIGEALRRMSRVFPAYTERLTDYQDIIGSDNVMSHQLFDRDYERLWRDFQARLPALHNEARGLISEIESQRETGKDLGFSL